MQRSRKLGFAASVMMALVIAASLVAGVSKVSATCGNVGVCWHVVSSPNVGNGNNVLNGVYAVSSKSIWAVGYYINNSTASTLIEQGVATVGGGGVTTYSWSQVASTNPGTLGNYLNGVGFARNDLNASDVWAVGDQVSSGGTYTLIEQYHNSSWTTANSPNPTGSTNSVLNAVAGSAASNYWAVGYYNDGTVNKTLIERYNGSPASWNIVASPNHTGTGYNNYLTSVSVVDNNTAWAVGYYVDSSSIRHPLLLEWNSSTSTWDDHTTDISSLVDPGAFLTGVSLLSSSDAWLVGQGSTYGYTLAIKYSHGLWSKMDPPESDGRLNGVDYIATSSAWTVGYWRPFDFFLTTDYWDGTQWTSYQNEQWVDTYLNAVSGVSNTDTWSVGYTNSSPTTTFIIHYN